MPDVLWFLLGCGLIMTCCIITPLVVSDFVGLIKATWAGAGSREILLKSIGIGLQIFFFIFVYSGIIHAAKNLAR